MAEIPWDQIGDSDPVGDLRAWQKQVSESSGVSPKVHVMTLDQLNALLEFQARMEALERELNLLPRRRFVRAYRIKREMGVSRRRILTPHVIYMSRPARAYRNWRWDRRIARYERDYDY